MKILTIVSCIWHRHDLARLMLEHTRGVARAVENGAKGLAHDWAVALVAVGSEGEVSRSLCEAAGWIYVEAPNEPLSDKWQAGVDLAHPTSQAIMLLGSDDFLTREIVEAALDAMDRGVHVWGLSDFRFLANGPRALWWSGYGQDTARAGEPMGAGRTFHHALIEKMPEMRLWPSDLNRGLDGACWARVKTVNEYVEPVLVETVPTTQTGGMIVDVKRTGEEQLSPFSRYEETGSEEIDWRTITRHFPAALVEAWGIDPVPGFLVRARDESWGQSKVAIVMIAKDAEATIERALRSALPVADFAVVVVDTRTRDATAEIARGVGCKVVERAWDGFSGQRNYAHLFAAPVRWHLVLDADEVIEPNDLAAAIRAADEQDADAVTVTTLGYSRPGQYVPQQQVRVVRSGRTKWAFRRHNDLVGVKTHVASSAVIRSSYVGRHEATAQASIPDLVAMWEAPSEPLVTPDEERAHAAFFLARAYMVLGKWEDVLLWANRCIQHDTKKRRRTAAAYLVWARLFIDGPEAGLTAARDWLRVYPEMAELRYIAFSIEAAWWFKCCLAPGEFANEPQGSMAFAGAFPQAAQMLGLPVAVSEAP